MRSNLKTNKNKPLNWMAKYEEAMKIALQNPLVLNDPNKCFSDGTRIYSWWKRQKEKYESFLLLTEEELKNSNLKKLEQKRILELKKLLSYTRKMTWTEKYNACFSYCYQYKKLPSNNEYFIDGTKMAFWLRRERKKYQEYYNFTEEEIKNCQSIPQEDKDKILKLKLFNETFVNYKSKAPLPMDFEIKSSTIEDQLEYYRFKMVTCYLEGLFELARHYSYLVQRILVKNPILVTDSILLDQEMVASQH